MATGYRCPVCDEPQLDASHLADHVALTAVLGDDAHEAYLDETVPGWAERETEAVAAALAEAVEPVEIEGLEDGHDHDHGHGHEPARPDVAGTTPAARGGRDLDPETRAVLEEARDLTREMLAGDGGDDPEGDTDTDGEGVADADADTDGETGTDTDTDSGGAGDGRDG